MLVLKTPQQYAIWLQTRPEGWEQWDFIKQLEWYMHQPIPATNADA